MEKGEKSSSQIERKAERKEKKHVFVTQINPSWLAIIHRA